MGTSCVLVRWGTQFPFTEFGFNMGTVQGRIVLSEYSLRRNCQAYLEVRSLLLYLLEPRLDRRERSGVGDAVDEQECVRRSDRESRVEEGQTKG